MMSTLSDKDKDKDLISLSSNKSGQSTQSGQGGNSIVDQSVFAFQSLNVSDNNSNTDIEISPSQSPQRGPSPVPAPIIPKGTLSVDSIKDIDIDSIKDSDTSVKAANKPVFKKAPVKKTMGARVLSSTAADVRFESFDAVEKRAEQAKQEIEDHKIAFQMQNQENSNNLDGNGGGSSRLAAIYQESENVCTPSIYQTPAASGSSSYTTGNGYNSSRSNGSNSSNSTFNVANSSESYTARDKYAGNKGISSDQFFGRDEEDMEVIKNRLEKLGSANAIGSDMLSSDNALNEYQNSNLRGGYNDKYSNGGSDYDNVMENMKDSVSNFFDDIQKRIGSNK